MYSDSFIDGRLTPPMRPQMSLQEHEPRVHAHSYLFYRGNFHDNSCCQYTRCGTVFPGNCTRSTSWSDATLCIEHSQRPFGADGIAEQLRDKIDHLVLPEAAAGARSDLFLRLLSKPGKNIRSIFIRRKDRIEDLENSPMFDDQS